jgi:hypothetical protein
VAAQRSTYTTKLVSSINHTPAPGQVHLETPGVQWVPPIWHMVLLWTPRMLHHHCPCPGVCDAWTMHLRSLCQPERRAAGARTAASSARVSGVPAVDIVSDYRHLSLCLQCTSIHVSRFTVYRSMFITYSFLSVCLQRTDVVNRCTAHRRLSVDKWLSSVMLHCAFW